MAEVDIKQMPYSFDAEQAVLGAVILDEKLMSEVSFLSAEDFYLEQHKLIYKIVIQMFASGKPIDGVTVVAALVENGSYTEGDAVKYIRLLVDSALVTSNIRAYADIVRDKAILRAIIGVGRDISDRAFSEQDKPMDLVDMAEQRIFEISQGKISEDFRTVSEVVLEEYDRVEQISKNPTIFTGIKTGFSSLDRFLVGMNPGDFVVVGARPGIGKTSFCLNVATNVAKSTKKEVAVFSLEMPAGQLVSRMLSSESGVDSYNLRTGKLSTEEWRRLAEASSSLSETNIIIDDTSSITVSQMKAKLRRRKDLALVIIDYLQLMTATRDKDHSYENRVNEVAAMTRALKLLAKDIGVPVILCSQLNRGLETREGKKPVLADLRESGSIEQDADMVILLYKNIPGKKEKDSAQEPADGSPSMIVCEIAKNRHGETAAIPMSWNGATYRFASISDMTL